eukprot:TRINITY_DN5363_c0_g1_i1.p1 TRINITY_DN5363_c0_g1~~TRINITY_DN5363_c0_g1_i1.p1  ORF type:complete len:438 (+),score=86.08 TRINITY_DN5363_c0_g1_i1:220-1533(+)
MLNQKLRVQQKKQKDQSRISSDLQSQENKNQKDQDNVIKVNDFDFFEDDSKEPYKNSNLIYQPKVEPMCNLLKVQEDQPEQQNHIINKKNVQKQNYLMLCALKENQQQLLKNDRIGGIYDNSYNRMSENIKEISKKEDQTCQNEEKENNYNDDDNNDNEDNLQQKDVEQLLVNYRNQKLTQKLISVNQQKKQEVDPLDDLVSENTYDERQSEIEQQQYLAKRIAIQTNPLANFDVKKRKKKNINGNSVKPDEIIRMTNILDWAKNHKIEERQSFLSYKQLTGSTNISFSHGDSNRLSTSFQMKSGDYNPVSHEIFQKILFQTNYTQLMNKKQLIRYKYEQKCPTNKRFGNSPQKTHVPESQLQLNPQDQQEEAEIDDQIQGLFRQTQYSVSPTRASPQKGEIRAQSSQINRQTLANFKKSKVNGYQDIIKQISENIY